MFPKDLLQMETSLRRSSSSDGTGQLLANSMFTQFKGTFVWYNFVNTVYLLAPPPPIFTFLALWEGGALMVLYGIS